MDFEQKTEENNTEGEENNEKQPLEKEVLLESPKNETPPLLFDEEIEKSAKNQKDALLPIGKKEAPIIHTVKNTKKEKHDARKNEVDKKEPTKITMAVIFSVEESEKVLEIFEARKKAGLSIDRNHFFRQMIHFAINAHKFNKPHFGQPDNTYFSLKNTF